MQSAADGSDRQIEDFRDRFITAAVNFPQDQHRAMFFGELRHALADLAAALFHFDLFRRSGVLVDRFQARLLAAAFDRNHRTFPPSLGGGHIEGNAVEPRVKGARALKRRQIQKSLHQSFLDDIAGVLHVADHIRDGIEKPVLILLDQISEGHRVAFHDFVDQLEVVAHIDLVGYDARRGDLVPNRAVLLRKRGECSRNIDHNPLFIIAE